MAEGSLEYLLPSESVCVGTPAAAAFDHAKSKQKTARGEM